jgi:glycosyltransferase involved in cell wall biosynthesis
MERPFFSIAIPTYGYNGRGVEFINHNLNLIEKQTFKDFEIVISDHSVDDTIKNVIDTFIINSNCKVTFIKCEHGRGYISPNLNNALKHSNGKYIKVLFQDDFLYDDNSLQKQYEILNENPDIKWLVTTFQHSNDGSTFYRLYNPTYSDNIWTGNNTLGNPSNLTLKNKDLLFFDEELNWLVDCEYYYRMFLKHGKPTIINEVTVVNRTHGGGLTDTTPSSIKNHELKKLIEKYT